MAAKFWIKLYCEILDDPKMAALPDHLWKRSIQLFLAAGRYNRDGVLPDLTQLEWMIRIPADQLAMDLAQLEKAGIVNQVLTPDYNDDLQPAWNVTHFADRQAPSPVAERVKQYRARKKGYTSPTDPPVTDRYKIVTETLHKGVTKRKQNGNEMFPQSVTSLHQNRTEQNRTEQIDNNSGNDVVTKGYQDPNLQTCWKEWERLENTALTYNLISLVNDLKPDQSADHRTVTERSNLLKQAIATARWGKP